MLAESLHSFQLQTYSNRELIVVNDGVPLAPAAAGVTVVNLPTRVSIGAKRNAGLAAARGELLAPWDDDDFSMPERLELQAAQLHRSNATSVRSSVMWLTTSDLQVKGFIRGECFPTALIRRETMVLVGGYPDLNYLEDMELYIRMRMRGMVRGVDDLITPELFYIHRRHTMNVSNPFEKGGDIHFKRMLSSPDVDLINRRLASLRALPAGKLVEPIYGPPVERVSAPTLPVVPAGWAGR